MRVRVNVAARQPGVIGTDNPICDLYYNRHHWDFRLGTYLALLRTMSIRSMVQRLYAESALRDQTFKRLKRTRELIATLVVDGLDSERGREALDRILRAHHGVQASNDEYRYVLSVFFLEPLRWNAAHGWKKLETDDRRLLFEFWMEVGERMQIADLCGSLGDWQQFQEDFEADHLGWTEQGQALAENALYEVVRLVIPRGMQELTRQALLATMEPRVREALGLRQARLSAGASTSMIRLASSFGAGRRVPTMNASTPLDATVAR